MFKRVAIIGDGAMGTVLAMLLCEKQVAVKMWGYDRRQLEQIKQAGENKKFFPGYNLPGSLIFESADEQIMTGAEVVVSAVPCQFMRRVWERLKKNFPRQVPVVSVTKGIENDSLLCPTEIISQVLGQDTACAVLSGPTIADELARKLPATACAASEDQKLAEQRPCGDYAAGNSVRGKTADVCRPCGTG